MLFLQLLLSPGHFNSRLRKETNKDLLQLFFNSRYFNSRLRKETNI